MTKVGQVGYGYLGKAYADFFGDSIIYDPFYKVEAGTGDPPNYHYPYKDNKDEINKCDIAVVAVPTDPLPDGSLDMSIIEETVKWLETPYILIKSALMPGTVDRLVKETGKKIAVSVEYIGMGNYYLDPSRYPDPLDPSKHKLLVVGGETETAEYCAGVLWSKMSPETRIHLVTAKEAEIVKLIENAYGALKVTFANTFYSLAEKTDTSFTRMHQAWSEDGRTDPMHTRVVKGKRGWKSHCYDKDIPALASFARQNGALDTAELFELVVKLNREHLRENNA